MTRRPIRMRTDELRDEVYPSIWDEPFDDNDRDIECQRCTKLFWGSIQDEHLCPNCERERSALEDKYGKHWKDIPEWCQTITDL